MESVAGDNLSTADMCRVFDNQIQRLGHENLAMRKDIEELKRMMGNVELGFSRDLVVIREEMTNNNAGSFKKINLLDQRTNDIQEKVCRLESFGMEIYTKQNSLIGIPNQVQKIDTEVEALKEQVRDLMTHAAHCLDAEDLKELKEELKAQELYIRGYELYFGEHACRIDIPYGEALLNQSSKNYRSAQCLLSRVKSRTEGGVGAFKYLAIAMDNDDLQELCLMAMAHHQGSPGAERSSSYCLAFLNKPLEKELAEAEYLYGLCLETGFGLDRDEEKAIEYFHKAADKGNVHARLKLALIYRDGIGVSKDRTLAEQ